MEFRARMQVVIYMNIEETAPRDLVQSSTHQIRVGKQLRDAGDFSHEAAKLFGGCQRKEAGNWFGESPSLRELLSLVSVGSAVPVSSIWHWIDVENIFGKANRK